MSKLEKLIQQYCPDGVEYKPLGTYLSYEQPAKYIVGSTKYDDTFPIPVLTAGQSFILGYTKETTGLFEASKEKPVIIFDDFTTSFHWVEFSFKVKSSAMKMLRPTDENTALFRYLYYCMKSIKYVPGDHTRQWIGTYSLFEIPVPPLPVQEEIVRILDAFTELQAELQAELQKRQQQYNFYRDNLLTNFTEEQNVKEYSLGELGTFTRGNGLQKKDFTKEGVGCIHYGQIYTRFGAFADKTLTYVSKELASRLLQVEKGNLVIACTSENVEDICKSVAWLGEENICTGGHACVFKHNQNPKYISYFFQTEYFFNQKKKYTYGTKVKDIKPDSIAKIKISLPSLKEQERIVSILDNLYTLTNDLSSGLPAEMEKRRQQYEYYRDRLLTFKRL